MIKFLINPESVYFLNCLSLQNLLFLSLFYMEHLEEELLGYKSQAPTAHPLKRASVAGGPHSEFVSSASVIGRLAEVCKLLL